MAKVTPKKLEVLVRDTSTTTYHFGLTTPIAKLSRLWVTPPRRLGSLREL